MEGERSGRKKNKTKALKIKLKLQKRSQTVKSSSWTLTCTKHIDPDVFSDTWKYKRILCLTCFFTKSCWCMMSLQKLWKQSSSAHTYIISHSEGQSSTWGSNKHNTVLSGETWMKILSKLSTFESFHPVSFSTCSNLSLILHWTQLFCFGFQLCTFKCTLKEKKKSAVNFPPSYVFCTFAPRSSSCQEWWM